MSQTFDEFSAEDRVFHDVRLDLRTITDTEILRQAALVLENEVKFLLSRIKKLMALLAKAEGRNADALQAELQSLHHELDKKDRMLFEPSSEKRSGDEVASSEDDKSEENPEKKPEKKPKKGHGPRAQPGLEVCSTISDLDEADKVCTLCHGELKPFVGQDEIEEEIDVIERVFVLRKLIRKKYRCRCGGCVVTADGGEARMQKHGRYSDAFAVHVVIEKRVEHRPLERQVRGMERLGLLIDSQVLWDQEKLVANFLTPVVERIKAYQLTQPLLFVDETRWPVHAKNEPVASKWHAWVMVSEKAAYFEVHDNRGNNAALAFLEHYCGEVTCDGYGVYKSIADANPGLLLSHCWAHCRRAFIDIEKSFPIESKWMVDRIRKLFDVEEKAPKDTDQDSLNARYWLRQIESQPVLDEIKEFVASTKTIPESPLDKAMNYVANRWSRLTRFVNEPLLAIDNNAAERALRNLVIGRKNHYGSRSRLGSEVAAKLYSLVETCRINDVDPSKYLRAAILARHRKEEIPLPHEWRGSETATNPTST